MRCNDNPEIRPARNVSGQRLRAGVPSGDATGEKGERSTPVQPTEFASPADAIARIARAAPARIALRHREETLSYGELDTLADHLACELSDLDVEPEIPVGILIERGFSQVVATLAVMRAGGAFVPIDPALPDDRILRMLEDSGTRIVIASFENSARVSGHNRSVLSLPKRVMARSSSGILGCARTRGDDLAYILYTSGSTGEPKGVEITYANLANLINWHCEAFEVTAEDRASHLAGLGFDASIWEIWPYLSAGASVSIPDEDARLSPEYLQRWLLDEAITIAFVPTALAEILLRMPWPARTSLRILLTGGDTLRIWPDPLPFELINNYGPTECTVVATSGPVGTQTDRELPSLGRAIKGTRIHILDFKGAAVRAGDTGEICIGGPNVGRGYRNRPELTAERFIADRFSGESGARLYRSGDLGALLPNGELVFHGRIDQQLKIRGHRIEPDEVAAALNRHPSVVQSVVVGRGISGNAQLVAYVVGRAGADLGPDGLSGFLADELPHYAIPAMFVRLDRIPLTASGKPDRAALPEPTASNVLRDTPFRAPGSVSERRLAEIMASVLGIDTIGADDNFFSMGGHSLLGSQLAIRVRSAFEIELALRDVFETRTVARLAERVERLAVEKLARMSEEEAARLISR